MCVCVCVRGGECVCVWRGRGGCVCVRHESINGQKFYFHLHTILPFFISYSILSFSLLFPPLLLFPHHPQLARMLVLTVA